MRNELQEWITQGDYNFAATANFNRHIRLSEATRLLKSWQCNLDRKVIGKNWKKRPTEDRIFFTAFSEHEASNLHFHMMLRLPVNSLKAQRLAVKLWQFIVPSGSMWISTLSNDIDDRKQVVNYATKDLWNGIGIENFIVSD